MKTKLSLSRIALWLLLTACLLLPVAAFAQTGENSTTVDERLWAIWSLETVEITADGTTKQYSLETLLANTSILPRNMFTTLDFFGNEIEADISYAHTEFAAEAESLLTAVKGTFTASNGQLTLSLREKEPRTLAYSIENNLLRISFSYEDRKFNLIYTPVK
ncbi:MAG: hypothetical protein FWH23_08210 [Bacteroidales bacterium]|nr:hypothetical protein [Bacteroidales bacterium]MCL2133529.1 hypothetical protein [Bacteroidales bacterium]